MVRNHSIVAVCGLKSSFLVSCFTVKLLQHKLEHMTPHFWPQSIFSFPVNYKDQDEHCNSIVSCVTLHFVRFNAKTQEPVLRRNTR